MTKYIVRLTSEEKAYLRSLLTKTKVSAKKALCARILLKCDISNGRKRATDEEIAKDLETSYKTVARLRKRLVEEGFEACLENRPYNKVNRRKKIEGEEEAKLISICCSTPPKGRAKWTMQLLANELVSLNVVESISKDTVCRALKKMNLSLG